MMNFLKSFFAGEKSAEEQAIMAAQSLERQRDVLVVDAYASDEEDCDDGEDCMPQQGCCGGGCRS